MGIGTWEPDYPMELETTGEQATLVLDRTDGATTMLRAAAGYGDFGTLSDHPTRVYANGTWKAKFYTDGSLEMSTGGTYDGTWNQASSIAYKDNVTSLTTVEAMGALAGLSAVRFNYKTQPEEERLGFIAEEVPDLVAMEGRKALSSMDIVAVLTKVVQQQQGTIGQLEGQNAELEARLAALEELMATLLYK